MKSLRMTIAIMENERIHYKTNSKIAQVSKTAISALRTMEWISEDIEKGMMLGRGTILDKFQEFMREKK